MVAELGFLKMGEMAVLPAFRFLLMVTCSVSFSAKVLHMLAGWRRGREWWALVAAYRTSLAASDPLVQEMMQREEAAEEPVMVEPAVVDQAMQELNSQLGDPLTNKDS